MELTPINIIMAYNFAAQNLFTSYTYGFNLIRQRLIFGNKLNKHTVQYV